jgi:uncharacterized metal-binding protein (TIGR02443 family)
MATNPKLKPCPNCKTVDHLAVYSYEQSGGTKHVECNKCFYLGRGEGSIRQAIKSHNEHVVAMERSQ